MYENPLSELICWVIPPANSNKIESKTFLLSSKYEDSSLKLWTQTGIRTKHDLDVENLDQHYKMMPCKSFFQYFEYTKHVGDRYARLRDISKII